MTSDISAKFDDHPCNDDAGAEYSRHGPIITVAADDMLSLLHTITYHSHALFASAVLAPFQPSFASSPFNHPPLTPR